MIIFIKCENTFVLRTCFCTTNKTWHYYQKISNDRPLFSHPVFTGIASRAFRDPVQISWYKTSDGWMNV